MNRSQIFKFAWLRTKADLQSYVWVYDWTPGPTYGSRRKTTIQEKRAIFAKSLRAVWIISRKVQPIQSSSRKPEDILLDIRAIESASDFLNSEARAKIVELWKEFSRG